MFQQSTVLNLPSCNQAWHLKMEKIGKCLRKKIQMTWSRWEPPGSNNNGI